VVAYFPANTHHRDTEDTEIATTPTFRAKPLEL